MPIEKSALAVPGEQERADAEVQRSRRASSPFRSLFRSMGLYTLAMVMQRSASILLLPLYTRYLSRADYGLMELLDLVPSIAGLLVGLRISQALFYFYHHAPGELERGRCVTTAFAGATLIGVVVGGAGMAYASPISRLLLGSPEHSYYIRVIFLSFAASLPVEVGFCYLRVLDRARTFAAVSLWRLAASVALNILFLMVFGMRVSAMLWSSAITTSCLFAWFAWVVFGIKAAAPSLSLFLRLARYSLPLAVASFAEFVLHFGDRLFLKSYVSLADLGVYGLAYKLGMIVPYAITPFFAYWNAQMVGIVAQPGGEQIYARMGTYLLLALTGMTLVLTVFASPLVSILAGPEFQGAALFIPWIALAYLIREMGSYWSNTFLLDRRSGLVAATMWSGCAACLLAYAALIPAYGLWGAVAATLLGFAVMAAFALCVSQRVRPFQYEYGRWAKLALCALASTLPFLLLHPSGFWMKVALGACSVGSFVLLLHLSQFATDQERRIAHDSLRRFLRSRRTV